MGYFVALTLAVGFGLPLAVLSAAIGQGRAVSSALEGMARQPEATGRIRTSMVIGLAFIESLVIYALLMFFLLLPRLPKTDAILRVIGGG